MDLNLYLGSRNPPSDLRMDLGSDLSLGPTSMSAPVDEASEPSGAHVHDHRENHNPHPPYSPSRALFSSAPFVGDNLDSMANDEIFRGITPYSPSQGLSSEPYHIYNPLIPYQNLSQSPSTLFLQSFGASLPGGDEIITRNDSTNRFYDPSSPGQSPLGGGETHVPYLNSFESVLPPLEVRNEVAVTPQQSTSELTSSVFSRNEMLPSIENLLQTPELRLRSLIETSRRRARRYRASLHNIHESSSPGASSVLPPERQVCNIMSDRPTEATCIDKVNGSDIGNESMDNGIEDKSRTINFECNICLDMAKDPVVTSCGHLFCWPCLYQWLHLHSVHKECPVCKGEVETNITPIYGRGSSGTDVEERSAVGGDTGFKIPPRPRGRRFESLRQQLQRPISRRLMEGITDPWRRNIGGDWRNLARMDDGTRRLSRPLASNTHQNGRLDAIHHRLRAHRHFRMADNLNFSSNAILMDLPTTLISDSQVHNASSMNQGAVSRFQDSLVSVSTESQSIIQNESAVNSFAVDGRNFALSASFQPENHETPVVGNPHSIPQFVAQSPVMSRSADQASASSTLALIQDDAGATDALIEPNSAGSSRVFRRRWTEASGSLDFDGGFPPSRKRRRLN